MKHVFLALGLMAAIACNEKVKKKESNVVSDSTEIKTTVIVATGTREFKAKLILAPKWVENYEPRASDTTVADKVRRKVNDSAWFLHVIDTIINKDKTRRPVDTFIQVNPDFILKDLKRTW